MLLFTEYNDLKSELSQYLKKFADNKKVRLNVSYVTDGRTDERTHRQTAIVSVAHKIH